jgi:hemolysin activation/secretion protein
MRLVLLILFLLPTLQVVAQLDPRIAPQELERQEGAGLPFGGEADPSEVVEEGAVLAEQLKGIALSDEAGETLVEEAGLLELLQENLGRSLTEGGLDRITDQIVDYYDRHDQPVVEVFVPEQDLAEGILRVEVTVGRLGVVGLEKSKYFNDELLSRSVRLEQGAVLRTSALQEQQDWLNRNPFRSAQMFAAPGEGFAEADILFSFEERYPLRAYLGYGNTGIPSVGRNRWIAGANWGNGFGQDQLVSYQFTMGDSVSDLQAHSVLWEVPLHKYHHFLRFAGAWAEVNSSSISDGLLVEGEGTTWQVSGAYGAQLPRWHGFAQEVSVGADFKTTDNFLVFGGFSPGGGVVDVVQARLDYLATRRGEKDVVQVDASLVGSPGGLSSNNEDANFESFREGASADYLYGRVKVTWLHQLPDAWTLRLAGQGQLASGKLLPIEQLALGGRDSVRGYDERFALADSGYHLSAEIRTPGIGLPGEALGETRMQLLGFLDHGVGWLDGGGHESLTGVGAGIRLQTGTFGEVRADVGWPLEGGDGPEGHFGVLLSF